MKRKVRTTLLAIIPATLGLALCAGLATNQVITKEDVETRAITPAANQSLYLDANASFWDSADAKYAVYAYNTTINRWSGFMSKATADTDISGLYKVTMDLTDMTGIIFVRMNTTATNPGWDTKWNQSENLLIADAGENDIYKITAWGGTTSPGEWHKSSTLSSKLVSINLVIDATNLDEGTPYVYAYGAYIKNAMAWPGVALSLVSGDLYTATLSETYSNIIFNNNKTENGRQTFDLAIENFVRNVPSGYSVSYKITEYDSVTDMKYKGTWDQSGTISNTFPKFNSSYMRLWLNRNGVGDDSNNFYSIHFWSEKDSVDYEIMPRGYNNFSNGGNWWFAYYDVPVAYIGYSMQFKAYNNLTGLFVNISTSNVASYTDGDNAMIYKLYNSEGTYTFVREVIGATANDVPAAAYKTVFEGYFSCSSDKNNGYGNYGQFSQTWIKNGETVYVVDGINGLATASINDFASKATEDYTTGDNRIHSATLLEKYTIMATLYNTISDEGSKIVLGNYIVNNQNSTSTTSMAIVVVVSILAINALCVITIFAISKKRKNNN